MKKLIAILLLAIYLFNLCGYTLLFSYFIHSSDMGLMSQLDREAFSDEDLHQLRIPLNLPYQQNNDSYERVDGSIVMNGVEYSYVKRRVFNDTLIILCLPNHGKMELKNAQSAYAGKANDLPSQTAGQKAVAKKAAISECTPAVHEYQINALAYTIKTVMHAMTVSLLESPADRHEHPPQLIA